MYTKTDRATGRPTCDAGFTLPIVLSVLVMLGVMGVAALQASRDELLSALGDSLVASWTTIENRCGFQVVYRRIDGGDGDQKLYSLESTGRTPGLQGATQRISVIFEGPIIVQAAMAVQGDFGINGDATVTGLCGSIHTNGDLQVGGNPVMSGDLSTSGIRTGGGVPTDTLGNPITVETGAQEKIVPDLDPMDYCDDADIIFNNTGQGLIVATSESFDFSEGDKNWGLATSGKRTPRPL